MTSCHPGTGTVCAAYRRRSNLASTFVYRNPVKAVLVVHPASNTFAASESPWLTDHASLVLGTRGSALALHQAEHVATQLSELHPGIHVQVQAVSSEGDLDKESPLTQIGGRGVFTSSLQRALTLGQVDAAVHSSKDVPSISATGLTLAAFPQREDSRDAVVSRHGVGIAELPPNPVIGTSSRRRSVQVLDLRPDARIVELRGNIDTRLRKASSDSYDAVILAAAGLTRMGWLDRVVELLPVDQFTPAPGQGALAIETRAVPDPALALVRAIDDVHIRQALEVERAFLRGVGGGCTTPLGAHAEIDVLHGQSRVRFYAMLARDDGQGLTRVYEEWPLERADELAFALARALVQHVHPNRVLGAGIDLRRQLRGMKVMVTGTEALAGAMTEEIRRRGGEPVVIHTIRIAPPVDPRPLLDAEDGLRHGAFDHIVFTSRQGVLALTDVLRSIPFGSVKVAAIGEATSAALQELGIQAGVVADDSRAEGMLDALKPIITDGDRVLLPVSNRARTVLADGLEAHGARVTRVTAYETHLIPEADADVLAMVERGEVGAVLLASPSAVEGFVTQMGNLLPTMSGASFVAIGNVTASAMRENGLPVHAMPESPGALGMVESLATFLWGDDVHANQ